ncbi:methyl-accepting chemotaxis protein [Pantoea agglomerans]
MTITQRLFLTFSLLSIALISIAVTAILVLSGFQTRFQYVQENTIPSIAIIDDMISDSNRLMIWLYRHQSSTSLEKQSEIENELAQQVNILKKLNQRYSENYLSSAQDEKLNKQASVIIKDFQQELPQFFAGSRAQNDKIALTALQGNDGVGESIRKLRDVYNNQRKINVDISNVFKIDNLRIYHQTLWALIIGSSAAVILLGLFTFRIIAGIRLQLKNIRSLMENASAKLDLTLRADEIRKDEIGLMAKAYNHLIENVALSLTTVRSSAQSVSTASAQISAGNEDLSSRTEEQAASLEQTAASMSQLSETVRQTAENTRLASQLSKNARDISEDSSTRVHNMLGTMGNIKASSSKITDIISLIEGIAFQTNILALNAAVEAARAGEQGRGFAVVAGEVRNLAQRSSASAKEIKELIESSMKFVESGVNQAEGVGQNMSRMNDAVRQVTDLIDEISVAAHEQSQGIEQVHLAVNQMDDVTQQNSALVQEASSASLSLMAQASALNNLVSTFTVGAPENNERNYKIGREAPLELVQSNQAVKNTRPDDDWKSF